MKRFSGVAVMWVLWVLLALPAWAHNLNMTGVKVMLQGQKVTVSVVAHADVLQKGNSQAEISRRLKLRIGQQAFIPEHIQLSRDEANGIYIWQAQQIQKSLHGSTAPKVTLAAPIFPEISGQTTVLTVIKDRQVIDEKVLRSNSGSSHRGKYDNANRTQVITSFISLGIGHIFSGIDHILFLLSLLLLGGSWKQLLKIVTAFTIAHSITLSLAATGVFSLPPRFVEPVIALSIVLVALSNLCEWHLEPQQRRLDWRPYMAFGFGLIHGFGFAGALSEVGLPREALAWALLAFNLGVEIGQTVLVLVFAPTLALLVKSWPTLRLPVVRFGSAGVAMVGAFWFIQRVLTP